jgi:hypothetical protein
LVEEICVEWLGLLTFDFGKLKLINFLVGLEFEYLANPKDFIVFKSLLNPLVNVGTHGHLNVVNVQRLEHNLLGGVLV